LFLSPLAEPGYERWGLNFYEFFVIDGGLVLILALAAGIFFTTRRAVKKGQKVWASFISIRK
jgi:hypothetical protein